ncbi:K(+)/H(+) antiporter NhaP2 [Halioglobus japonicus]|nr:K(+)/H(+) antiporter NhaP2 [Halioglobus japonicus]
MYETLAVLALFVLVYSAVAGRVERSWISGPMIFTCFGLLIGPLGFDLLVWDTDRELVRSLAEVTLAMVLFTDAAGAHIGTLKRFSAIPVRLLLIGLPLTIALGFVAGVLLIDYSSLLAVAVLAVVLSPTDAALGKAVVTNEAVPDEIRQSLNVESGLNDGICVPVLLLFLTLALDQAGNAAPLPLAAKLVLEEIGIGLAVGLGLTFLAISLLKFSWHQQWLTKTWIQIPIAALALSCFAVAQYLGGSGFIAAFSGGLLMAFMDTHVASKIKDEYLLASEGTGDTLALVTWVIFGSALVGQALGNFSWMILLYAFLSLTVIRMLPVYLCLAGSGIDTEGKLFIGWFGPRGLASIVFTVMVLNSGLPNTGVFAMTVVCTIVLSIIGHGITANSWARAYGRRRKAAHANGAVSAIQND